MWLGEAHGACPPNTVIQESCCQMKMEKWNWSFIAILRLANALAGLRPHQYGNALYGLPFGSTAMASGQPTLLHIYFRDAGPSIKVSTDLVDAIYLMEQGRLFFEGGWGGMLFFFFSIVECSVLYGQVGCLTFRMGPQKSSTMGKKKYNGCLFFRGKFYGMVTVCCWNLVLYLNAYTVFLNNRYTKMWEIEES